MKLYFEPRDLWVGLYWDYKKENCHCGSKICDGNYFILDIFICVIPCFPLKFTINNKYV